MRTTKKIYSKTLLSIALIGLSGLAFANDTDVQSMDNSTKSSQSESMKMLLKEPGGLSYVDRNTYQTGLEAEIETSNSRNHDKHLKEHGGQVFQTTKFENEWTVDEDGKGTLGSKIETLIGTDENRLFIEANLDKAESHDPKYDVSALYSRNVAPFWDVQAGVRYSEDKNNSNSDRVDGVIGVLGLAPYFFETQAYLYGGDNNFWGASLEVERDFLLTQKLITQPYLEVDAVFSDDSNYAAKSGLSELKTGIKTRYEITKRIRPFIDVAYQYEKGQKATSLQEATDSEKGWVYGAGIELVF
ncbi:copper resistance protein B [Acinetobacter baumannii]|jgi:copper resistance protein B|uniref:Autotransporter domain-containing protein n=9 Tax=Acinetobacter baumannii TaxID=470 RepID=A0A090C282_ACIBA|nr:MULTISPECIES: copper resistance protein B [Acinetobacter]EMT97729.1 copper resistance protein B [Acinetobacter baumannii ABNIH6]PXA51010.1 autotransporter domain-containing protein [Acinetobacter baumannii A424]ACJ40084.1 copper resistance protein CopB [Acinetobacter baumannii AB0057]AJF80555.1 Copper resistance protein B precursor [Acinetobacter baumannii]AKA33016.1 copper resistance protein B [Acinetobacter baumannii]